MVKIEGYLKYQKKKIIYSSMTLILVKQQEVK